MKRAPNDLLDGSAPIAFAHRGGAALFPENTLLAFERGLELGATALELDVRQTRDGQLVVFHDPTVDRTTDGSGPVSSYTLNALQRLNAGYRFTPDGETRFPFRSLELRIPTFAELVRAFPDALLNVELKVKGLGRALLEVVEEYALAPRLIIAAHHHHVMEEFRRLAPHIATSASRREAVLFRAAVAVGAPLKSPVFRALQVPPSYFRVPILTRAVVGAAHQLGVKVHAWTINEARDMHALLDLGVDGVMTDRPDTLRTVLAARKAKRP